MRKYPLAPVKNFPRSPTSRHGPSRDIKRIVAVEAAALLETAISVYSDGGLAGDRDCAYLLEHTEIVKYGMVLHDLTVLEAEEIY